MDNQSVTPADIFVGLLRFRTPSAVVWVRNGASAPAINGLVEFYHIPYGGALVEVEISNLPDKDMPGATDFCVIHIHQNGDCSDNFVSTGEHYNPTSAAHPNHVGNMIPLLGSEGYAWTAFYDKRFKIEDILGRPIVIHSHPDDFTTQSSGNSGGEIACGTIMKADYTDQVRFLHLGAVFPECVWDSREYARSFPKYAQSPPECV